MGGLARTVGNTKRDPDVKTFTMLCDLPHVGRCLHLHLKRAHTGQLKCEREQGVYKNTCASRDIALRAMGKARGWLQTTLVHSLEGF